LAECGGFLVYPKGKRGRGGWCSGGARFAGERGQDEKGVQLQGRRAGEAGRRDNRGRVGAASGGPDARAGRRGGRG